MKALYDESTKTFLTFQTANEELKSYIAETIHDEVKQLIDQDFSTIKIDLIHESIMLPQWKPIIS